MKVLHTFGGRPRAHGLTIACVSLALIVAASGTAIAASLSRGGFGSEQVDGIQTAQGILLPTNQHVRPAGVRYEVSNGRLLSSSISPNGKDLAALSWSTSPASSPSSTLTTGKLIQQVGTGSGTDSDRRHHGGGRRPLLLPRRQDAVGSRRRRTSSGSPSTPTARSPQPDHDPADSTPPSTLPPLGHGAVRRREDELYVALNGANTLGVIDITTNTLIKQIPVGNAPRQVVLVGNGKLFVSNEGGRPPVAGDVTNLTDNTPRRRRQGDRRRDHRHRVRGRSRCRHPDRDDHGRARPDRALPSPASRCSSPTPTATASRSSTTTSNAVTQTFNVAPLPGSTVGSNPNAITMPDAQHILVSIGRDNALAVYDYSGPTRRSSTRAWSPPTGTRSTPSSTRRSARSSSPTTRASAPVGPETTIAKGQYRPDAAASPATTPTTTPARSPCSRCPPTPTSAG